jgi:hypothetical protein
MGDAALHPGRCEQPESGAFVAILIERQETLERGGDFLGQSAH